MAPPSGLAPGLGCGESRWNDSERKESHPGCQGKRKGSFDRISHPSGSPREPAAARRPIPTQPSPESQTGAVQALPPCRRGGAVPCCSARNSRKEKTRREGCTTGPDWHSLLAAPTLWETTAAADWHGGCQRYPLRGRMAARAVGSLWCSGHDAPHAPLQGTEGDLAARYRA